MTINIIRKDIDDENQITILLEDDKEILKSSVHSKIDECVLVYKELSFVSFPDREPMVTLESLNNLANKK